MQPSVSRISHSEFRPPGASYRFVQFVESPSTSALNIAMVQMDWGLGSVALARDLRAAGHQVFKIGLHAADAAFALHGFKTLWFNAPLQNFESWLEDCLLQHQIDAILVLNGDRDYNRIACQLADEHAIEVFMLELGYVRPLHITAYSAREYDETVISRLWKRHLSGEQVFERPGTPPPRPLRRVSSRKHITRVACVALVALLARHAFPHYRDQRVFRLRDQFWHGLEFLRRSWTACCRAPREEDLLRRWSGTYFLVPFQVASDCQVVLRSEFRDLTHFLERVADSFHRAAPSDARLVIKFHPQDRGCMHYGPLVREMTSRFGSERVAFVDAVDLERAITQSRGVVTINSTVGLTALRHGRAVKALGRAIYDQPELSYAGSLDDFWTDGPLRPPSAARVEEFVALLEATIQGRGSLVSPFYRGLGRAGTLWPRPFAEALGLPSWSPERLPASSSSTQPAYPAPLTV